jgi:hypothetical protein
LGAEWQQFIHRLPWKGTTNVDAKIFHAKDQNVHSVPNQIRECLNMFEQENPEKLTREVFVRALMEDGIERGDLVTKLDEMAAQDQGSLQGGDARA